jgi:hypothetical protein
MRRQSACGNPQEKRYAGPLASDASERYDCGYDERASGECRTSGGPDRAVTVRQANPGVESIG